MLLDNVNVDYEVNAFFSATVKVLYGFPKSLFSGRFCKVGQTENLLASDIFFIRRKGRGKNRKLEIKNKYTSMCVC